MAAHARLSPTGGVIRLRSATVALIRWVITPPAPPTSFYLLEDGVSFYLLEDGTSRYGLE